MPYSEVQPQKIFYNLRKLQPVPISFKVLLVFPEEREIIGTMSVKVLLNFLLGAHEKFYCLQVKLQFSSL